MLDKRVFWFDALSKIPEEFGQNSTELGEKRNDFYLRNSGINYVPIGETFFSLSGVDGVTRRYIPWQLQVRSSLLSIFKTRW